MGKETDQRRKDNTSPDVAGQLHFHPDAGGGYYEIHVKGHLDCEWSDWLGGLEMKLMDNGEMALYGYVVDQSALMGILNKLSHLNLALISVNEVNRRKETQ